MGMRYVFSGNEAFHDEIAARLSNAGFERGVDVASVGAIITFFTSQTALEEAYFGDAGFVSQAQPGTLLVDLSATTPEFAREVGAVATVSDLGYVEAPIAVMDLFDARAFEADNILLYAAGEEDAVESAAELLETISGNVVRTGVAGSAQLVRSARSLQLVASTVAAIEAQALVAAVRRATVGSGITVSELAGTSDDADAALAAVAAKSFEGPYTAEMLMAELTSALAAADDADLILPQAEAAQHLLQLLMVIGGAGKSPAALSLVYGEEAECAENGLDWSRAEDLYSGYADGDEDDEDYADDYGFDGGRAPGDDCGHDHGFGFSVN